MKMTFDKWESLKTLIQEKKCQDLNPYEEWDVFKGVESAFLKQFGDLQGVEKALCGLGPCMGPYNSIVVTIRRGQKRTTLPEKFMGFPVIKEYQKKK